MAQVRLPRADQHLDTEVETAGVAMRRLRAAVVAAASMSLWAGTAGVEALTAPAAGSSADATATVASAPVETSGITLHDTVSSNHVSSSASAASALRSAGWTGKGVTVAVVDTGCDATRPDLADSVVHNVDVSSGVPVDRGPGTNTDPLSGHGTHVAGIVSAGRGSTGRYLGVAPDAKIVCYALGPDITTATAETAYTHLIAHAEAWGIDVVTNSWGLDYAAFDPTGSIAQATKTLHDMGIVVVFSAGNAGFNGAQLSLSPYAQLPWTIGVAAADNARRRAIFSSNGLLFDNSTTASPVAGGHAEYLGSRLGLVHPDISAPGVSVLSTCAQSASIGPCDDTGHARASGTSMAAPAIAGAAAVLLQARPSLTPDQVKKVLLGTASTMLTKGTSGKVLPLAQVGFGHVNLDKAVRLVRRDHWRASVRKAYHRAVVRVNTSRKLHATVSDVWTYEPPLLSLGVLDSHHYTVDVSASSKRLSVALTHPSALLDFTQGVSYTVTITSPTGATKRVSTQSYLGKSGFLSFSVPLGGKFGPGQYRVDVKGSLQVLSPVDWLGADARYVVLDVAQAS